MQAEPVDGSVDEADRVVLRGIRGYGRHGVHDHEREVGQPFVVDLTCWLDSTRAARTDDLEATVHYGILSQRVVADIEAEPVQLIEALAQRVATTALSFGPVARVEVTVHKPKAPVGAPVDDVSVTLTRSKPS